MTVGQVRFARDGLDRRTTQEPRLQLDGLDPQAYLRHVIERIAGHPANRVHELLPWAVDDDTIGAARPPID